MPRPVTTLVIDDEAHVRMLLSAILKQLGVKTVWEAIDGAAGLAQVAAHRPDLVLLDINLPEISGLDVLSKLKTEHSGLPVIVVSAQSTARTVERARALGADGFIVKYAAKSEIVQSISDELDRIGGVPEKAPGEDSVDAPAT